MRISRDIPKRQSQGTPPVTHGLLPDALLQLARKGQGDVGRQGVVLLAEGQEEGAVFEDIQGGEDENKGGGEGKDREEHGGKVNLICRVAQAPKFDDFVRK